MQIGPNGPVPLDPGTYDYDDLGERLRVALAGSDEGRWARVRGALRAARFYASQIPVIRILSLSTSQLKEGQMASIEIRDVIDGVTLTGPVPDGMVLNSIGRTITGTPRVPGHFTMRLTQTMPGAIGSGADQWFDLIVLMKDGTAPPPPPPTVLQKAEIGSDSTPQVDEPLTGYDPVFRYATIIRRRWLFAGTSVAVTADYTPRVVGTYQYSVDGVGDDGSPINSTATITVAAASTLPPAPTPISISGTPFPTGKVGEAYSFTPSASNGSGAKTWTLLGTLVSGLTFDAANGSISGTPTAAGVMTSLRVRVTDSTGSATTTATDVTIAAAGTTPPPNLSPQMTAGGEQMTAGGQTMTAGVY